MLEGRSLKRTRRSLVGNRVPPAANVHMTEQCADVRGWRQLFVTCSHSRQFSMRCLSMRLPRRLDTLSTAHVIDRVRPPRDILFSGAAVGMDDLDGARAITGTAKAGKHPQPEVERSTESSDSDTRGSDEEKDSEKDEESPEEDERRSTERRRSSLSVRRIGRSAGHSATKAVLFMHVLHWPLPLSFCSPEHVSSHLPISHYGCRPVA